MLACLKAAKFLQCGVHACTRHLNSLVSLSAGQEPLPEVLHVTDLPHQMVQVTPAYAL